MSVVTATILSEGQRLDPARELVSIDVRTEVNRIAAASLALLDGDAAERTFPLSESSFFEPGREIEIKLRWEDGRDRDRTVFKGVVIRHGIEAGTRGTLLTVELRDKAVKLSQVRNSAVYRNKTDGEVMKELIQGGGLRGTVAATQPKHAELVQFDSTDWDFILSRADVLGLLVVAAEGEVAVRAPDLGGRTTHAFEFGLDDLYDFEIEADALSQFADLQAVGWDVKNQKTTRPARAKSVRLSQGTQDGARLAKTVGFPACTMNHLTPMDPKELGAWADARLLRSRLAMIRGRLSAPGLPSLRLLDVAEIKGVGKRFNGRALVTGIRHRVDREGWTTDVQFGLSPDWHCREPNLLEAPANGLLPAATGLQIGVVGQFEEDPDKELRVRVILPGIAERSNSVWARLASPDAGKDRGFFFRPEPGDEVVVGFLNNDPRHPVILGALFGSKNSAPSDFAKLTGKNLDKGIVSRQGLKIAFVDDQKAKLRIETPGKHKIVLDDDEQSVLITDASGNSITLDKGGIHLKSKKDLKIEASGNVEIKGAKVDVK